MKVKPRYYLNILVLTGLYIVAAKLGLLLAFGVKQITTVWPPSGLALAALIIFGYELWPGILIGAFIANLLTSEPAGVALGIAIGNTLEALVGAALLKRVVQVKPTLERVRGVIGLVVLAALFSTTLSASIGTTSLAMGGLLAWKAQPNAWVTWWFGDMAGILLFAPLLLIWSSSWRQIQEDNITEFVLLLLSTGLIAATIFFEHIRLFGNRPQMTYFVFPLIIWAAFRFKQLGVTAVSIITSIIAVLSTTAGHGPFTGSGTTQQQLVTLLIYIIIITTSGLFMGVAVLQRESYEQKLLAQAEELLQARDKILLELNNQTEREEHLRSSNERITNILGRMLEEKPQRSNHNR